MKTKKLNHYLITIIILILAFAANFILYDYALNEVKDAKDGAKEHMKDRDFDFIWNYLTFAVSMADEQCKLISKNIEKDIRDNINLEDLEKSLNNIDPTSISDDKNIIALHDIFKSNMEGVHFGNVKNNRNSMLALEGYDYIIEDMFVSPRSRSDDVNLDITKARYLSMYQETTYNKELFDSAVKKIHHHTDGLIAIEPYNYLGDDHIKIKEMSYLNLKKVYDKEGLDGLRNYQFLVPIYITDTGDIFGNYDRSRGIPQITHKFTVIILFNLYDQINNVDYNFAEQNDKTIDSRYNRILDLLHIVGIILCIIFATIIIYSINMHNQVIDRDNYIRENLQRVDK